MKTVAIIQARMGATRLPGKLLLPLSGRMVLDWVLDRVTKAASVDQTVLATTALPADDCLAAIAARHGVAVFRGSETDVLARYTEAARSCSAGLVVRVNADNPFIDPARIDELVAFALRAEPDYASYRRADGKPVMLTGVSFFAEAVTGSCLERAYREIADSFQREHVTLGIYTRPESYRVAWLDVPDPLNDPRLRFTLDTREDLSLLEKVATALGPRAGRCKAEEVAELVMRHPEWLDAMERLVAAHPKSDKK